MAKRTENQFYESDEYYEFTHAYLDALHVLNRNYIEDLERPMSHAQHMQLSAEYDVKKEALEAAHRIEYDERLRWFMRS